MSEQTTPERKALSREEMLERARKTVESITSEYNLTDSTLDQLELTDEQKKQATCTEVRWNKMSEDTNTYWCYTGIRTDGTTAKFIILPMRGNTFALDSFSPGLFEGHGGNNDFNASELKDNIKLALELPSK